MAQSSGPSRPGPSGVRFGVGVEKEYDVYFGEHRDVWLGTWVWLVLVAPGATNMRLNLSLFLGL